MAISLNIAGSVKVLNPFPLDYWRGPWIDVASAKAGVPLGARFDGLTVKIIGDGEYWWLDADLTDTGLIPKSGGGSSTLAGLTDVSLSSPVTTQYLKYNGADWVNAYFTNPVSIPTITANAYTLQGSDRNKILHINNGSTNCTITLPDGFDQDWACTIIHKGTGGIITLVAATTLESYGTTIEIPNVGAAVYNQGSDVWTAIGALGAVASGGWSTNGSTSLTGNVTINVDGNTLNFSNSDGTTYVNLQHTPSNWSSKYFFWSVTNGNTYEANIENGAAGITNKWSADIGATGAYTLGKYGWGEDTETDVYGFHIYSNGTTYGGTPADADLKFRIRSSGEFTMNLGSDATGDLFQRNASGYLERIAIGSNTYVLTSNGTTASWAAPSGGSGITIGSTAITGGTSGRLLTSGTTVGELTLGTGVSTWLGTPSWTNFNSAITGTAPYLPIGGATYTTTTGNGLDLTSSTVTTGNLVSITNTGAAAASNTKTALFVGSSGANASGAQSTYAGRFSNTNTGTNAVNYGVFSTASGGTTNYDFYGIGTSRLASLVFSGGNITSQSTRIQLNGATTGYYGVSVSNSQTLGAIDNEFWALSSLMSWSTGAGSHSHFTSVYAAPTINVPVGTGNLYGFRFDPTLTNTAGIQNIYAFHASSGDLELTTGNITAGGNLSSGTLTTQTLGDTKRRTLITDLGTLSSSSTSTQSILTDAFYANGTTLLAEIKVVGIKVDGTASAHATLITRFRKDNSGTWTCDDAGTAIISDVAVFASVVGDFSTNPNVDITMGASSGDWNVGWTAYILEVKN